MDSSSERGGADLWLDRVDGDPALALASLTELLGNQAAARDAMINAPVIIASSVSVAEARERIAWLRQRGLLASGRPPRRSASIRPSGAPRPSAKGTSSNAASSPPATSPSPPITSADELEGEAEVTFTASLLASFLYPFHREAIRATVVVLVTLAALEVLLRFAFFFVWRCILMLAIVGVQFAYFSFAVRSSAAGQDRYRVSKSESMTTTVFAAGLRSVTLHFVMFAPILIAAFSPTELGVLVVALYLVGVIIAMPGTYAVTALSDGFFALNPLVGLALMRRLPVAYFLSGGFMVIVITFGFLLAVLPMALDPAGPLSMVGALLSIVISPLLMLTSGRILGLFIYSNRHELGI